MARDQVDLVKRIVEQHLLFLPAKARVVRAEAIAAHFTETLWMGECNDDTPFYN